MTGCCKQGNEPPHCIDGGKFYWLVEQLLASQKRLCSMKVAGVRYDNTFHTVICFCTCCIKSSEKLL